MSNNPVRVQPDLKFVKELQEVGGESLKKCYQCATCSVVCPLSPADDPYPRKEMVWAQWGLKDRLLNDIDIWLCHNCGTCSDLCPRGAKPGDLLGALRNMAYRRLGPFPFIGKWMSSSKYLPLLIAIPAILYLAIWIIRAGQLGTAFPLTEDGSIKYGLLFPGNVTIDPIFGLLALMVLWAFYVGVKNLLASFAGMSKTFIVGRDKEPTWCEAIKDTLINEVGQHTRFAECGNDEPTESRVKGHLLLFYGFVCLFIVTTFVAVGHWGGYIIPVLHYVGDTPMPLYSPIKLLAIFGAVLLITGLVLLTKRRASLDETKQSSSWYDWYLLGVIWTVGVTGILCMLLRWLGSPILAYPMYYLHLISVFMLIGYLPWSKLGHLVYRTTALAYARKIGRIPMK